LYNVLTKNTKTREVQFIHGTMVAVSI